MRRVVLMSLFFLACNPLAGEGEACSVTSDCAEGLECHAEDGTMACHGEHEDSDT